MRFRHKAWLGFLLCAVIVGLIYWPGTTWVGLGLVVGIATGVWVTKAAIAALIIEQEEGQQFFRRHVRMEEARAAEWANLKPPKITD